jgi:uncharacterized repeat protein (TIGR02543 family)
VADSHIINVKAAFTVQQNGAGFAGMSSTDGGTVYLSGYDDGSGDSGGGSGTDEPLPDDPIYTLTLDASGGTFTDGSSSKQYTFDHHDSSVPTQVEVPTRNGYQFTGFYDNDNKILRYDSNGAAISPPYGLTVTLYAQWTSEGSDTITLHANGGTFKDGSDTLVHSALTYGAYVSDTPSRQGYTFKGFAISLDPDDKIYIDASGRVMASDIMDYDNLYAVWEQNTSTDPWDNVDENAAICDVYIDDTGTMHARNFRIHSEETIIIDSLGDVYAKSFIYDSIIGIDSEGIHMINFELIREEGWNIKTIADANNNIVVDNNNNIIVAAY